MDEKRKIYSVAELNRRAKLALEGDIGSIWVEGEVSRITKHASGHWFFPLKDETSVINCVMFQRYNSRIDFDVHAGLQVRLLGAVSIREDKGEYQIIVSKIEEAGKGALQEQFEKLKKKLDNEGLFDKPRKRLLPLLPNKVGVVTSPTGAAIRDIVNVLKRRFPNIQVLLAPALVQGERAAQSIVNAIEHLNTRNDIDLIIAGRGGGSLEDLWAFNEEIVARAIAASEIPIISAVGHEIDFTIADFVADLRAPTPSAAAELAVPVQSELDEQITRFAARLGGSLQNRALVLRERIPGFRQVMTHALRGGVQQRQQRVDQSALTLLHVLKSAVGERKQDLKRLKAQLQAYSPLGVLDRGYSLTETADGAVVRDAKKLKKGDQIRTRFAKGTVLSEVKEKEA